MLFGSMHLRKCHKYGIIWSQTVHFVTTLMVPPNKTYSPKVAKLYSHMKKTRLNYLNVTAKLFYFYFIVISLNSLIEVNPAIYSTS